jgi:putative ABC transport system permease protein
MANMRKNKGQMTSLLIFVLASAMLLSLGLMLIFDFGKFFDTRAEALHAPHYSIFEQTDVYSQEQIDYFKDYPGFSEVETEKSLGVQMDIEYNDGEMPAWLYFMSADYTGKMNGLDVMEGKKPEAADEICLPYLFKVGGGYKLGDEFKITANYKTFSYRVSGFTEEI